MTGLSTCNLVLLTIMISPKQMMDATHLRGIVSKAISSDEYDGSDNGSNNELVADIMDDNEAEEARKYFGVF